MRLRARVSRVTGSTERHVKAKHREVPPPSWVEIETTEGAYLLLHLNEDGECIADTWHQSIEEAKEEAMHEFEIDEDDWEEVESETR